MNMGGGFGQYDGEPGKPRVPRRANFREIGWGEVRLGKIESEVETAYSLTPMDKFSNLTQASENDPCEVESRNRRH